jgi:hypothetical protein
MERGDLHPATKPGAVTFGDLRQEAKTWFCSKGGRRSQYRLEVYLMDSARLVRFSAVALATLSLSGIAILAQAGGNAVQPASPPAVQVPTTSTQTQSGSEQTQPAGNVAVELKPVKAELVKSLDSKSAKPGDPVIAKTEENIQTANGTEIPKGSKLIGTVTLVKPHSKQEQNSELAVKFDRAQLKGGQDLAIHSVIQSLSPPNDQTAGNSADLMEGTPMAGTPSGSAPSGGGAMGGSRSASSGAPASPSTPTMGEPAGNPNAQSNGPTPGKVVAGSGPNAIRTTSIPNVYLASNANGPVSGTLFSAKSNVRLDGGTRMVLDIAASNSK